MFPKGRKFGSFISLNQTLANFEKYPLVYETEKNRANLLPGYFIVAIPTGETIVGAVSAGGGHGLLHYAHLERFILAQGALRHCHSPWYRRHRLTCRHPRYYHRHAVCLPDGLLTTILIHFDRILRLHAPLFSSAQQTPTTWKSYSKFQSCPFFVNISSETRPKLRRNARLPRYKDKIPVLAKSPRNISRESLDGKVVLEVNSTKKYTNLWLLFYGDRILRASSKITTIYYSLAANILNYF
ncbi:hypothetical protein TcasGA2_TC001294 [Tribolium castaneum]|uniref:Uncharacterized protein n=1 Tax=Tribolium castaneum TaxID=7070 RepID=D6WBR7_TRICA|nr:hypothetical protein TcasGA2_TC001294 [Tribolium castaneum]